MHDFSVIYCANVSSFWQTKRESPAPCMNSIKGTRTSINELTKLFYALTNYICCFSHFRVYKLYLAARVIIVYIGIQRCITGYRSTNYKHLLGLQVINLQQYRLKVWWNHMYRCMTATDRTKFSPLFIFALIVNGKITREFTNTNMTNWI